MPWINAKEESTQLRLFIRPSFKSIDNHQHPVADVGKLEVRASDTTTPHLLLRCMRVFFTCSLHSAYN
eukprot:3739796-Amphidinium_carterae.1